MTYIKIILLSLVLSVYLFEGLLSYKDYLLASKKQSIYKKKNGKNYDIRKRIDIYKDLKKTNQNIVVSTHAGFIDKNFYSLSGAAYSKTIFCNESGEYAFYMSDRYGFNNPDYEWDNPITNYLLIGDSYTHGACVDRPNDIASHIRVITNKSVINLGYEGNGPLKEYASLREYLPVNTEKILWFFHEYDLVNLKDNLNNYSLIKYLEDDNHNQNLKENNLLLTNLIKDKIEVIFKNKDSKYISNKYIKFIKLTNLRNNLLKNNYISPDDKEIFYQFEKILRLIKKKCNENNIELHFILLPGFSKYTNSYKNDMIYNKVKNTVLKNKINVIDIDEVFFKLEKDPKKYFPFESYNHYNKDGYKKISYKILEIITNSSIKTN